MYDWKTSPRKQLRLPHYDYSLPGSYFVTSCTANREAVFTNKQVRRIVMEAWLALQRSSHWIALDTFVIMPDHIHGLITLLEPEVRETDRDPVGEGCADLRQPSSHSRAQPSPTGHIDRNPPLTEIMRLLKTISSRRINTWRRKRQLPTRPVWQRSFYDRIARGDDAVSAIRHYITSNPLCAADEPALFTDAELDAQEEEFLNSWRLYLPRAVHGA